MDWETLLAVVGIYILLLANMMYHWMTTKRLIELNTSNNRLLESNERVLKLIGGIIVDSNEEKEEKEHTTNDYKIKFNLPTTW